MAENIGNTYYRNADKLLVAIDCIVFGFDENQLKLLLFKRKVKPFRHRWSLIGSFVKAGESASEAAERILNEYTGLRNVFIKQLRFYGDQDRDPGGRVISLAYYSLISLKENEEQTVANHQARWFNVSDIPLLIMDHNDMVYRALEKLKENAKHYPIGFELLPKKFTIPQLQSLYEAIYQKNLDRRNFRKKILSMGILEKLEEKNTTDSKKGAFLYRFDKKKYQKLTHKGFIFDV